MSKRLSMYAKEVSFRKYFVIVSYASWIRYFYHTLLSLAMTFHTVFITFYMIIFQSLQCYTALLFVELLIVLFLTLPLELRVIDVQE